MAKTDYKIPLQINIMTLLPSRSSYKNPTKIDLNEFWQSVCEKVKGYKDLKIHVERGLYPEDLDEIIITGWREMTQEEKDKAKAERQAKIKRKREQEKNLKLAREKWEKEEYIRLCKKYGKS